MPSIFANLAASVKTTHEHFFAELVALNEAGQAVRNVPAVLGKVETRSRIDEHGRQQRDSIRLCRFTSLSDVRHDATVTIGSEVWSIESVVKRSASGLQVQLSREQTHEVARVNYRGRP